MSRRDLLDTVAARILDLPSDEVLLVAIDGVDGAGKTVFADELAGVLAGAEREIIRASVDAFHNPRKIRYRQGRASPRGEGSPDPHAESNRRYVEGQIIYLSECSPREAASIVIDNEHLDVPRIVEPSGAAR